MPDQHHPGIEGRAPLTEEDVADRTRVLQAWTTQARDGLVPLLDRIGIDRRMREWAHRTPQFLIDWATGITSSLIATLPAEDPWRTPATCSGHGVTERTQP